MDLRLTGHLVILSVTKHAWSEKSASRNASAAWEAGKDPATGTRPEGLGKVCIVGERRRLGTTAFRPNSALEMYALSFLEVQSQCKLASGSEEMLR